MNILFIPHIPNRKVVNRVYEFAKNSNSLSLYWSMESGSFIAKVISQIDSLKIKLMVKICIFLFSLNLKISLQKSIQLLSISIKKLNIRMVGLNANASTFDIKPTPGPGFMDLVDEPILGGFK